MEQLSITPTNNSLEVSLNARTGKLLFSGRSYPENSIGFFKPIMAWMEEYALNPNAKTECICKLEYVNSASRKCFVDMFAILESMYKNEKDVTVIWYADPTDDAMNEMGEEYTSMFKMKFVFENMESPS